MYNRPRFPLPGEQLRQSQTQANEISSGSQTVPVNRDTQIKQASLDLISATDPRGILPQKIHALTPPNFNNGCSIPTNKFYGNLLLPKGQELPLWTHPFSLWYSHPDHSVCVSYTSQNQRVFDHEQSPPQFYFNPVGIKSIMFSVENISNSSMSIHTLTHMSCQIDLVDSQLNQPLIQFPLVQGAGFITALYKYYPNRLLRTCIKSMVGFRTVTRQTAERYEIVLNDNKLWYLYCNDSTLDLNLTNPQTIVSSREITRDTSIQVTVWESDPSLIPQLDQVAGYYPTNCEVSPLTNSLSNLTGYCLNYTISGYSSQSSPPQCFIYALPHHMDHISSDFIARHSTNSYVNSTVSGTMTGFITDKLIIDNDNYLYDLQAMKTMSFHPFGLKSNPPILDSGKMQLIKEAARREITEANIMDESNLDSMYFSGKVLAKYAWILYSTHFILRDLELTNILLSKLQRALDRFVSNTQIIPLNYDMSWKGVISSTNEPLKDFGNSFYNDHHFHYGYFVITGAIIAKVEQSLSGQSSWLQQLRNKDWIECLIRDYDNPSSNDPWFPQFRSFDWFNGHSWAKGLFESGDGKDQESSSEDVMSVYAVKLWSEVTNNQNLENIATLQLTILKSSINHYFLYTDDNTTEPSQFIANRCSGILFENKIHHTTYFGNNLEYIQMIHAIPLLPVSASIRSSTFVRQEWDQILSRIVDNINDGWKGIIMLNVSLCDPYRSYSFFSNPQFNKSYLDGGQSLTWSLVYSASLLSMQGGR
ncbi:glucan endo-1,3-beta-D-glucosidase 2 [Monosporozyma unispora]